MNLFCRPLLALISTLGLSHVKAGETVYFLVAEGPSIPETDRKNDSYVLPLSKAEDINYARYLISRFGSGYAADDRTIVVANVAAAKDNINRNFLDTKLPKWSWQISQFLGFAEITAEVLDGNPTQLEPFDGSHGGQATIGFWDYTVVKELGSVPLYLSLVEEGQNLQFYWSCVGTNYVYTLEGKESLTSTNWLALPGASWPLKTNQWTSPLTNAQPRIYRIRAEQSNK